MSTTDSVIVAVVERQPLGAAREQQRLAVLDVDLVIGGVLLVGEAAENAVVVDDAVLNDLNERRALVLFGAREQDPEYHLEPGCR